MIIKDTTYKARGHRGHDRMVVGFTTTVQSVPIATTDVGSNPANYVIKVVSDM
jgi:hypothetical protein